ncbi:exonuclease gor [Lasius niger]|uniref:Exonuclease gor n=1 Tax=Lasius niger TaxID=67767 RepID=A0A0J7NDR9_LASNI|nr:exonuclease gor [Lasius niger]
MCCWHLRMMHSRICLNHNLFDHWNHGEHCPERRRQVTTMIHTDNAYRCGHRRVKQPIWRPRYFPNGNTDTDVDWATENDNLQHDIYQRQNIFQVDHKLYRALKNYYILKPNELKERGFPVESHDLPGHAMIKNISYPTGRNLKRPDTWNIDDQDSGSSSDSTSEHEQENSSDKCFDGEKNSNGEEKSVDNDSASAKKCDSSSQQGKRECVRCHKSFYVDQTGKYLNKERCVYHWGKLFNRLNNGETNCKYWTCCPRNLELTRGCAEAEVHVWNGLIQPEENGPLAGYVRTLPYNPQMHNDNYSAYALDCEMCYTQYGLELTKVTLVNLCGKIIYNKFVKPQTKIIDYNTRFNGITEEQMLNVTTTLKDVQRELRTLIHADTILLGHNLASDFRALRFIHDVVIDTTSVFEHYKGFPYCYSLKTLARGVMRTIQVSTHDSIEDARVVVDIVLQKVHYDLNKSRFPGCDRNEPLVIGMESTYT